MKKLSYNNPAGNEHGSKTVATIMAVTLVGIFIALIGYALVSPQSPLRMIFAKKSFDYDQTRQRAYTFFEAKQYETALEPLEKMVEMKPDEELPVYRLGITYAKLGYAEKAVNQFKKAIELKPDFLEARASLASMYLRYGQQALEEMDYPKARDYLRQAALEVETALAQKPKHEDFQAIHKMIIETEAKLPEE